jgi:hypothetical protein
MSETTFTAEEREFLIASFEQGKAERALADAESALELAQERARVAYIYYLAARGITVI